MKLIMKIKAFFAKVVAFVKNLFSKAEDIVEEVIPVAVKAVNVAKEVVEGTAGDVIEFIAVTALPGSAENIKKLRAKLVEVLPVVLLQLQMVDAIADIEDPNEKFKAIIVWINNLDYVKRSEKYSDFAAMLAEAMADGKLTFEEAWHLAKNLYDGSKKQK